MFIEINKCVFISYYPIILSSGLKLIVNICFTTGPDKETRSYLSSSEIWLNLGIYKFFFQVDTLNKGVKSVPSFELPSQTPFEPNVRLLNVLCSLFFPLPAFGKSLCF